MEIDFQKIMTNKSDEGLQEYLDKRAKYTPDAVEAAIMEFQNRGRAFSDEELSIFRIEIQQKREVAEKENKEYWSSSNKWKKNVILDENAPIYYSETVIYSFTILCGALFGSILLATNFRTTENKKGVWEVVFFGILYTSLQLWILSMIPGNTISSLLFNIGGAIILNQFFWKKYIGKDTKYRTKPIWIPLIVGLVISIMIILATFYAGSENL